MKLDDAFANAAYIPNGDAYPAQWAARAEAYRAEMSATGRAVLDERYGEGARNTYDVFLPSESLRGVIVFVHGGYWLRFDKSSWSHLARCAVEAGWVVAMPSYDLCPSVRISEITAQVRRFLDVISERFEGPIRLAGHSAGGHLVGRMVCSDQSAAWQNRIERVVPISPVADLAPLMETSMNEVLGLKAEEARAESLVSYEKPPVEVTVFVGADERPVFVEQAGELARRWQCGLVIEPQRHHFDVIEGLENSSSELFQALCGEG